MTKMKALVKSKPEEGLWMEEVDVPSPARGEVRIKILKTAICGTDVHIYNWDDWSKAHVPVGLTIGHEFAGLIDELGEGVTGFELGELVSGEGHIVCGKCRNCLAGRQAQCSATKGIGVSVTGVYSEYVCIPVSNIWRASKSVPPEILAFYDPLGNATHTALSYDLVGEDVLITGAGPIGCMAAAIATHVGARYVVVTDVNPYRLDLARQMGATLAVDVRTESVEDAMKKLGMREGFDVGMEMSGNPAALNSMIENMINGGRIALLGILPKTATVNWDKIIFGMLKLKGIYGREMYETWYKMDAMIESGLDMSPILTHQFDADDFQKGFDVMRSGQSGKVVLNWAE